MRLALVSALAAASVPAPQALSQSEPIRVASYNASLNRSAPGLLLKDLHGREDPQIAAVAEVLLAVRPDVVLINEFDYDGGNRALETFRDYLADEGIAYPHLYAAPSNTGEPSSLDLDRDGQILGPGDAFGYGQFPGQYGMAVLSMLPIDEAATRTFRLLKWRDLPAAKLPTDAEGEPYPSEAAHAAMRLSSKSHWDVVVETPEGPLHLLASHPTPPVFDGPEDLNGKRNHDEIMFWVRYLDGTAFADDQGRTAAASDAPFVVVGDLNADPADGDGIREAVQVLLDHERIEDPAPQSAGAVVAAEIQGAANGEHTGPAATDTADWNDDPGPGNLRVDYALPSTDLRIEGSGVFWPVPGAPGAEAAVAASDHRLVWVDVVMP